MKVQNLMDALQSSLREQAGYDKEIELHNQFVKHRYRPLHKFKGEFECYSLDILPLIKDL